MSLLAVGVRSSSGGCTRAAATIASVSRKAWARDSQGGWTARAALPGLRRGDAARRPESGAHRG